MSKLQTELDNLNNCVGQFRTPLEIIQELIELRKNIQFSVNKKRKEMERRISQITDNYKFINQDVNSYLKVADKEKEINSLNDNYNTLHSYFQSGVSSVLELLNEEGFINGDKSDQNTLNLTLDGKIASQIREIHCLAFTKLYNSKKLDELSSKQLVALFSCFTNTG